ncbi:MAG: HTH domain-containing protein [Erysipelotrichaceae bacterium]|nr:HTH domain-containing protein [Erysipelotrichaceae bacterium]
MINERDKLILKKIIQSDRPLSGAYLSNICQVSINTIRKEINIINDYLEEHGCHIDIKVAIGYTLVIDDEAKARPFISQLIKDINTFGYLNINDSQKVNYIIRRLLASNKMIPIEVLMNELFCSKSTVLRNLEKATEYLSEFNLTIKIKRNSGLYIEGKEWNKRMCLVHQHKILRHSSFDSELDIPSFNSLFLDYTDYYDQLKSLILLHIKDYPEIAFSQVDLPTIINFTILCITRQKYDHELQFTQIQLETAHSLITHQFAQTLLNHAPAYFKESIHQKTLDAVSMMLAGAWKINKKQLTHSAYFDKYRKDIDDFVSDITNKYDVGHIFNEQFYSDLSMFIIEQKRRDLFEIYSDEENFRTTNKVGLFTSDLCAQFAYSLWKRKNIRLNPNALNRVYSIFNTAFYENDQFFEKQSFCVVSRYGAYFAKNMKSRIQKTFSDKIHQIDTFEYTDLMHVDLSQYDAIISDISVQRLPDSVPHIEVDFQKSITDFDSLTRYFDHVYSKHVPEIFKSEDFIIGEYSSEDEIYDVLYDAVQPDSMLKQEWINDCKVREEMLTFKRDKEIVLITNMLYESDEPVFKLIVNKKPILWNNEHYRIFIYYHRGQGSAKEIQMISHLCKKILKKPEWFLNSLTSMSYEELIKQF